MKQYLSLTEDNQVKINEPDIVTDAKFTGGAFMDIKKRDRIHHAINVHVGYGGFFLWSDKTFKELIDMSNELIEQILK